MREKETQSIILDEDNAAKEESPLRREINRKQRYDDVILENDNTSSRIESIIGIHLILYFIHALHLYLYLYLYCIKLLIHYYCIIYLFYF